MEEVSMSYLFPFSRYQSKCIVCIGVSTPLKNTTPLVLANPSLNPKTVQTPLFKQSVPLYQLFVNFPLLKVGFFSEPPKY